MNLPERQHRPAVRLFALDLAVYSVVAIAVAGACIVLASLLGGALGLSASIRAMGVALVMLVPGAVLSALILSWLQRGATRPESARRGCGGGHRLRGSNRRGRVSLGRQR